MDLIIVTPSPKINFATSYSVQGEGGAGRSDHIWKKYLPRYRGQFGRGGRPYMEVIFITSSEVSEAGGGVGAAHIWK